MYPSYENDEQVNSDNTDDEMKRGSDSEKAEATIQTDRFCKYGTLGHTSVAEKSQRQKP